MTRKRKIQAVMVYAVVNLIAHVGICLKRLADYLEQASEEASDK